MPRIIEGKEMNLIGDRLRVLRKKTSLKPATAFRTSGNTGCLYLPRFHFKN